MGRIRSIKPEFFKHEALFDAEMETGLPLRVAFAGLWCASDREGRFDWRPRTLKSDILPHDDVDFSRVLHALTTRGFVRRYASNGVEFGYIPTWHKHQVVNNRERASEIPEPPDIAEEPDASATRAPRDSKITKRKGREGNKIEEERSNDLSLRDKASNRGTRLPEDWKPPADDLAFAATIGLGRQAVISERAKFVDYWRSQPGQKGVKVDWSATYRNWLRNAAERYSRDNGKSGGSHHSKIMEALRSERDVEQEPEARSTDSRLYRLPGAGT